MARTIEEIFDEVMRCPESARGLDVPETCRLLAEKVKTAFPNAEYEQRMRDMQDHYLDQFLHTSMIVPDFPEQVRKGIALYI